MEAAQEVDLFSNPAFTYVLLQELKRFNRLDKPPDTRGPLYSWMAQYRGTLKEIGLGTKEAMDNKTALYLGDKDDMHLQHGTIMRDSDSDGYFKYFLPHIETVNPAATFIHTLDEIMLVLEVPFVPYPLTPEQIKQFTRGIKEEQRIKINKDWNLAFRFFDRDARRPRPYLGMALELRKDEALEKLVEQRKLEKKKSEDLADLANRVTNENIEEDLYRQIEHNYQFRGGVFHEVSSVATANELIQAIKETRKWQEIITNEEKAKIAGDYPIDLQSEKLLSVLSAVDDSQTRYILTVEQDDDNIKASLVLSKAEIEENRIAFREKADQVITGEIEERMQKAYDEAEPGGNYGYAHLSPLEIVEFARDTLEQYDVGDGEKGYMLDLLTWTVESLSKKAPQEIASFLRNWLGAIKSNTSVSYDISGVTEFKKDAVYGWEIQSENKLGDLELTYRVERAKTDE